MSMGSEDRRVTGKDDASFALVIVLVLVVVLAAWVDHKHREACEASAGVWVQTGMGPVCVSRAAAAAP